MLKVTTVVLVFGLVLSAGLPLQAAEPKNADEVIAKYLQALGGREKLAAIKTMRIKGKVVVGSGAMEMEMPLLMELKRPGKMRSENTVQGHTMIQGYDGTRCLVPNSHRPRARATSRGRWWTTGRRALRSNWWAKSRSREPTPTSSR